MPPRNRAARSGPTPVSFQPLPRCLGDYRHRGVRDAPFHPNGEELFATSHYRNSGLGLVFVFALLMSGLILYETSSIVHGGETNYIMA